jgi:hypothetical protein
MGLCCSKSVDGIPPVSAYSSPVAIHRVYMFYMQHRGWYCQFLEEDPKASLPRKFTFATSDKVVELVERAGGVKNTETRQALEYGINIGRGGVFLNLTGEQYSKLREGEYVCR